MPAIRLSHLSRQRLTFAALLILGASLFTSTALASPPSSEVSGPMASAIAGMNAPLLETGPTASPRPTVTDGPSATPSPIVAADTSSDMSREAEPALSIELHPGDFAIPDLGIDAPVHGFPSGSQGLPDATSIWVWPPPTETKFENHTSLLAHAYGAFSPIYHGYHTGALHPGLTAIWLDEKGLTHEYVITRVDRVTVAKIYGPGDPTLGDRSIPTLTLMTCDDSDYALAHGRHDDAYRIIVTLVLTTSLEPD